MISCDNQPDDQLEHLAVALCVLLGGLGLAFAAFVLERCVARITSGPAIVK
jgi:hypothetical protein